jgi:hypothetical protein
VKTQWRNTGEEYDAAILALRADPENPVLFARFERKQFIYINDIVKDVDRQRRQARQFQFQKVKEKIVHE